MSDYFVFREGEGLYYDVFVRESFFGFYFTAIAIYFFSSLFSGEIEPSKRKSCFKEICLLS